MCKQIVLAHRKRPAHARPMSEIMVTLYVLNTRNTQCMRPRTQNFNNTCKVQFRHSNGPSGDGFCVCTTATYSGTGSPERGLAMDRVSYIHNSGKCLSTLIIARHHVTYAHAHLGNTRLASSEHHVCFEMATRNRL